ncbi:cyanophycinase [Lutispora saccharofermentans]|uniref:Cyanophycinase n=1 Tax=Lutispora saccharofermentans TaxID=3024236 RepID=A0ABT1NHS7_9FIRM|nr:cyanophycinase [Lutispora saccharofermentans]MCQ1530800.1 cyanophycinase [Lutispora saccharofermentans]
MPGLKRGTLVIIGGAEDKTADMRILKIVYRLSGGDNGTVAVVTTATNSPYEAEKEYNDIFKNLGSKAVYGINISNRAQADDQRLIKQIRECDCIFFVGGDQLRISSILGGTEFHKAVLESLNNGKVIAGTSAGASMMSQVMVVEGRDDEAPRKCTLKMAPGMGLLQGVIIDQHFNQRGRIGRLLAAVAQNPGVIGIGIDEDTAAIVNSELNLKVAGSGVVTVVDGRDITFTNTSEQYAEEPLAITNVKIHVFPEGYGFNLVTKQGIIQKDEK